MAEYPIKIVEEDGKKYIFDGIRRKYVSFSPEEEVRQSLIQILIEQYNYPKALFSVEKTITLADKRWRYDVVIYKGNEPWMLCECKRPEIKLGLDLFLQSSIYQQQLGAQYLVLTNSIQTLCYDIQGKNWLDEFPKYNL